MSLAVVPREAKSLRVKVMAGVLKLAELFKMGTVKSLTGASLPGRTGQLILVSIVLLLQVTLGRIGLLGEFLHCLEELLALAGEQPVGGEARNRGNPISLPFDKRSYHRQFTREILFVW
jgi:hypothetical protein